MSVADLYYAFAVLQSVTYRDEIERELREVDLGVSLEQLRSDTRLALVQEVIRVSYSAHLQQENIRQYKSRNG